MVAVVMAVLAGPADAAANSSQDGAEAAAEDLPSVAELYRCYISENGGLVNIRALQTLIVKGRLEKAGGETRRIAIYRKRPDKLRFKVWFDDVLLETIHKGGEIRRLLTPLEGDLEPKEIAVSPEEVASLAGDARLEGPFFMARGNFEAIQVVAREEVRGWPAFRLRLAPEIDVPYHTIWLDEANCQEIKLARTLPGGEEGETVEQEVYFSGFEKVGGVYTAREVDYFVDGEFAQRLEVVSVRANVGLFDSYFELP